MVILILGSEGFIGSHLARYFLSRKITVHGCDLFEATAIPYNYRKISRLSPELDEVFAIQQYDVCINAAGSGNVNYSMTHPFSDFEANGLDTIRVLDCIRRLQPSCKYIHLSSAAVYGNPAKLPICEEDKTRPLSPYGWHKLIAEHLCAEYSTIYKLRTIAIRPFSVYGPGLRKQLFWDLYKKVSAPNTSKIVLWGTGAESRDFIFIDDLVRCIHLLMEKAPMCGEVYNVATGTEITIKEIATLFCKGLAPHVSIDFNFRTREGDPTNWRANISRIAQLGFQQQIDIQTGINRLVEWLNNQS